MNVRRIARLLIVGTPASQNGSTAQLLGKALDRAGAEVHYLASHRPDALREALSGADHGSGQPPDAVLLELSVDADLQPLQHLRWIECTDLGGAKRPLLALVQERHLRMPELSNLADDFLLPPYRLAEVMARLGLIQQRRGSQNGRELPLRDIEFDPVERRVRLAGSPIPLVLTPREHALLGFLALHRGKALSRKVLLTYVWGPSYGGGPRTVDIHIRRLREKLPPPYGSCIETVRHVGYRLREARERDM